MPYQKNKTLRLLLGDQLNIHHSWFQKNDDAVTYVIMEVKSETDYAVHHIQKVIGMFAAMRKFAQELESLNHQVIYIHLNDENNFHRFDKNCLSLIEQHGFTKFEYQLPDEYRLDQHFKSFISSLQIPVEVYDTEHFYTSRTEFEALFVGKKNFLMETFYRYMRKKHKLLVDEENKPLNGQWNFDQENREKLPKSHVPVRPFLFSNDLSKIEIDIKQSGVKTIGTVNSNNFIWPVSREQALQLLDFFMTNCLRLFGTFQDAMAPNQWSLYHSRLSFSLNIKLISPKEVIDKAIDVFNSNQIDIQYHQLEGFVRQIIGWREYMRGIYWLKMPDYATLNFFQHKEKLPEWFWTGKTKMNCLQHAITQSLDYAYAHHIQRLMVTGNFALLAGIHPDEVDAWYLGIYIDAFEWVEITNTRGMSQFADGGMVGTKPYVSSASYIHKMSSYCSECHYDKSKKTGQKACPFNSLYWNFFHRHEEKLFQNPRMAMMFNVWRKMLPDTQNEILKQADFYLKHVNEL